jgi:hypothetical protein
MFFVRYELDLYILFGRNSVFKRLIIHTTARLTENHVGIKFVFQISLQLLFDVFFASINI